MNEVEFVGFLRQYVEIHDICINDEPPQASLFVQTEGFISFEYPHITFNDLPIRLWSLRIREALHSSDVDGVVFWCVLTDPRDDQESVMFFIYDKALDTLNAFMCGMDMLSPYRVFLEDVFEEIIDDYGIEPIAH